MNIYGKEKKQTNCELCVALFIGALFFSACTTAPVGSSFQKTGLVPVARSEFSRAVTVTNCNVRLPFCIS